MADAAGTNFRTVVRAPFTEEGGRRVLQCHSRGDVRFSPFGARIDAFAREDLIENHYQRAKVFVVGDGEVIPADWREARELKRGGRRQVAWQIGPLRLDIRPGGGGSSFALDDPGIQFYCALWAKFIRDRPDLVEYARGFDDFCDPFRGSFPFCQADVWRLVAREGLAALEAMSVELVELLLRARGTAK